MGEWVLSTEKLTRILEITSTSITVEAGISVAAIQEALAAHGSWFPPAPTWTGAFAGGVVATNAAGAATFKYGPVRPWVEALTVVLGDGTTIAVRRGEQRARDGWLRIETSGRTIDVPVPTYTMPDVPKRSAGYHAESDMDLVDLFIGSEGTLGVITSITFRVLAPAPTIALALVPCPSEDVGLALVADLRRESMQTWQDHDRRGLDASAIEHMDARCLDILREDGADRKND